MQSHCFASNAGLCSLKLRSAAAMLVLLCGLGIAGWGAETGSLRNPVLSGGNLSLRYEVEHAISQGVRWLERQQNTNGSWSTPDHPAVTALALVALQGSPAKTSAAADSKRIDRGYEFIRNSVQPDGGIYRSGLENYNTALCVIALVARSQPEDLPVIQRARRFIIGLQGDFGEAGQVDDAFDGGIGYGKGKHADLSNTVLALEALHYSRAMTDAPARVGEKELNWAAVVHFLENCQNLSAYNEQPWASDDPKNRGGFVYSPNESKAGEEAVASGRVALRSYGSMSYAGLLSYIYARLERTDPRVLAVHEWLRKNFTLDENPGLGAQGLYYYYHTMAKALSVYGVTHLETAAGDRVNWREALALKLINLQQSDGNWMNENGRWWEKDPVLVTSYAIIALEIIYRGL